VQDPDDPSQTLYDTMIRHHPPIDRVAGAGTDFAAFLQYIGVPSLDMSYGTSNDYILEMLILITPNFFYYFTIVCSLCCCHSFSIY
jgi:hypothetical protein